ncbi:MAG: PrsW family intramembrane metalloprotease [Oscillospiraceae bacterium]|nr:PrsW family intramembrane metalloprotease [Oscillospiraceae bacterium]
MNEILFQFIGMIIIMNIPLLFVAFILGDSDSRRIVLFFCWGWFAGALAFTLNSLINSSWEQSHRMTLSIAPIVEEICKGLPLLFFLNEKKYPHITKVIVYCAMVSGIGFSVQETMYYFDPSLVDFSNIAVIAARSLTTALMHGMTTAVIGIGLLFLNKQKFMLIPSLFALFSLSTSIHAIFNLLLQTKFAIFAMLMPISMFIGGWLFIKNHKGDSHIEFRKNI